MNRDEVRALRRWRRIGLPPGAITPPARPVVMVEDVFDGQEQTRLERLPTAGELAALCDDGPMVVRS